MFSQFQQCIEKEVIRQQKAIKSRVKAFKEKDTKMYSKQRLF